MQAEGSAESMRRQVQGRVVEVVGAAVKIADPDGFHGIVEALCYPDTFDPRPK
jgi:hypothetical protein